MSLPVCHRNLNSQRTLAEQMTVLLAERMTVSKALELLAGKSMSARMTE